MSGSSSKRPSAGTSSQPVAKRTAASAHQALETLRPLYKNPDPPIDLTPEEQELHAQVLRVQIPFD